MPFPSVDHLVERLRFAARRFPAVIPASVVATGAAFSLINDSSGDRNGRLLLMSLLGFPLMAGLHFIAERRRGTAPRILLPGAGLLALGGLFVLSLRWPDASLAIRFIHWALLGHLLAAVAWFLDPPERPSFWQFNRLLFERFLMASLFAAVLAIGLAVALLAIDRLFGVDVDGDNYPRIFAVIAFVIHPWFFLAGVPTDRDALDRDTTYPPGLKVFAQYILIPLVTVYLLILTAYLGRVIITREWPSGWIGWLVSSVAATGTLALLLVHPLRERQEGRWVNAYGRWFFVALLPSLVMLLMAVGKRIGQYGVTEPRYALALLGGWLTILAGYFAISRSRSIRVIPASLGAVALAAAIGPWGMVGTARRSQVNRFHQVMTEGAFAGDDSASTANARQLSDGARYLWRFHGAAGLARVAAVPAESLLAWDDGDTVDVIGRVLAQRGVSTGNDRPEPAFYVSTRNDRDGVEGIELSPGTVLYGSRDLLNEFRLRYGADTVVFRPVRATGTIGITGLGDTSLVSLAGAFDSLRQRNPPGQPLLLERPVEIHGALGGRRIRLLVSQLSWAPRDSMNRSALGSIVVSPD